MAPIEDGLLTQGKSPRKKILKHTSGLILLKVEDIFSNKMAQNKDLKSIDTFFASTTVMDIFTPRSQDISCP